MDYRTGNSGGNGHLAPTRGTGIFRALPTGIDRATALFLTALASISSVLSIGDAWAQSSVGLRYEAVLEWNGPHYSPMNSGGLLLETNTPIIDYSFEQPRAIAAREHAGRDVVYVLDSGRNRIQVFETNATFRSLSQADLGFTLGAPVFGEFNDQVIRAPEWLAVPTQWIVPHSDAIYIDGVPWERVDGLTGFTSADRVYSVDYSAVANQPQFDFPAGSLNASTLFEIRYLLNDLQDGGTPTVGLGDVDYGVHSGATTSLVQIDEATGGPTSWQELHSIAVIDDITTATSDHLFVTDVADNSSLGNEQLFSYLVALDGSITVGETYDDVLDGPYDVSVAHRNGGAGATASLDADTGPFDQASYPFVTDANQITGHTYTIEVATGEVTITDATTGRVLVDTALEADVADPFLGIPGTSLPLNAGPWADGTTTLTTHRALPGRYLFVTDTGNDRIKIIGLQSGTTAAGSNWSGDWLPTDARTVVAQPTGAGTVGLSASEDYRQSTPAIVGEDWVAWTTSYPLAEGTLRSITFDPDGVPGVWNRVDDVATAAPTDSVFQVDWVNGMIMFGDGIHGSIPPATTDFEYNYAVTPDVLHYGTSGTGNGRFTSPRGISARWNDTLSRFDVYVADAVNHRVQKFAFSPSDTTLGIPPLTDHIASWDAATVGSDLLNYPSDVQVAVDGTGTVFVGVADPGNNRVVIYRDTEADVPGSTLPPNFDAALGSLGNQLGNYLNPGGIQFLSNGTDLDLYVADESRDVVTKYEEGPTPTITLLFTGQSALPACFPPQTGYPMTFTTTHPPLGGWVDFYLDYVPEFDENTAKLAVATGSVSPTATTAYFDFAATPGGTPPDGSYYLFARLKDATGSTVAWDATEDPEVICVDSSLIPTLQARDAIDGDRTLYLQNGLRRDVALQLTFPDSINGVTFGGTFDPNLLTILAASPGTAWDGLGYTNHIFTTSIDTLAGTFEISSTLTDAPTGLTGSGPFDVAYLQVVTQPNAIAASDRFKDGVISVQKSASSMFDVNGAEPEAWTAKSLQVRVAYLGDIATTGAGADSTVPNLQPRPDGRIDFEDQVAFTLGWNGDFFVRDPIGDMGPATGTHPGLWPVPDKAWDVDDTVVFTGQFSFFADQGWNTLSRPAPEIQIASNPISIPVGVVAANSGATSDDNIQTAPEGTLEASVEDLGDGRYSIALRAVDVEHLMGARLALRFDARFLDIQHRQSSGFLGFGAEELVLETSRPGFTELGISRLSAEQPSVSGSGPLASFELATRGRSLPAGVAVSLEYDLRNRKNRSLGAGELALSLLPGHGTSNPPLVLPTALHLAPATPNPARPGVRIDFGLPRAEKARLMLYDVSGRIVRTLFDHELAAGYHSVSWDGHAESGDPAPSGVYYYRLRTSAEMSTQKMLFLK